jgi:hypothetical protein
VEIIKTTKEKAAAGHGKKKGEGSLREREVMSGLFL